METGSEALYEYAEPEAKDEYRKWLESNPEMRRRTREVRDAEKSGEGPKNPVSLERLSSLIDEARRERTPGRG